MAALINSQVREMWQHIFRQPHKATIKADPPLPSRAELKAIFQVFEDEFDARKLIIKTAVDVAAGRTVSAAFAKVLYATWLGWKFREDL